jgi:hypothetical protein
VNGPADAVGARRCARAACSEPCGHTKDALKRMSACAVIRSRVVSLSEAHPNPTTNRLGGVTQSARPKSPVALAVLQRQALLQTRSFFSVLQKEQSYGSSWAADRQG